MIANHAQRAALSEEMHVRRLPRFAAPCRLMQIVTLLDDGGPHDGGDGNRALDDPGEEQDTRDAPGSAQARAHLDAIAAMGQTIVPVASKYAVLALGEYTLVWERHTEFASYTLLAPGPFGKGTGANPFDPARFAPLLDAMLADMPGAIVRATQIAVLPRDRPDPADEDLAQWFDSEATVVCDVADGKARIISDFRLNADGYGRLLVLDRDLSGDEPSQLVQRVQELGNYRNMALLGLPLAQSLTPEVTALERRLAVLTQAVAERTSEDDALLDELTFLSAELARLMNRTRYRMTATRAYSQISVDRLAALHIGAVRGFQTLADFTERRLMPAVRTCESFSLRLEDLSQRAAWTSELLRTRIDTALSKQNRDLLTSMDRRATLQLRLQQTVEGLSVVAISYYLVGLVSYLVKPFKQIAPEVAVAVAVPVILMGVALSLRKMRRRLHD